MTGIELTLCIIGLICVTAVMVILVLIVFCKWVELKESVKFNMTVRGRLKSYCSQAIRYCSPEYPIAVETLKYIIDVIDEMSMTVDSFRSHLHYTNKKFKFENNCPDMTIQNSIYTVPFEFGRVVKTHDSDDVLGVIIEVYSDETVLVQHKYDGNCEIYKVSKLRPALIGE